MVHGVVHSVPPPLFGAQSKNRAKTRKNGHSWASQYHTWVGRASIERGLADQYQAPSGLGGPVSSPTRGVSKSQKKTYCRSTSFLTADDSAKKTGKIFTLFDAGAVPTRRRLPGLGTVPARETPLDHRWPSKPANLVPCLEASKAFKITQKHAKTCKKMWTQAKTSKKHAKTSKTQPAEGCNQGAIRVQSGCNQGAKGCNPKIVQKQAKTGTVGRVSNAGLGEPVSSRNGLGEPVILHARPAPCPLRTSYRTVKKKNAPSARPGPVLPRQDGPASHTRQA